MGLTIHYKLWLPPGTPDASAIERLRALRAECALLGAANVTPFLEYSWADLESDGDQYPAWSAERIAWWLARASAESRDGQCAGGLADDEPAALMFYLYPGEGCEAAAFGLARPGAVAPSARAERADLRGCWYWSAFCKTQFASALGDDHLVRCHTMVVRAIETALQLGFDAEVHDETGYWSSRSTAQLITGTRRMNRIVARIAGALHDTAPDLDVESPVFRDPDFERLESEPREE